MLSFARLALLFVAAAFAVACQMDEGTDDSTDADVDDHALPALPDFVDDCEENANDDFDDMSGLEGTNHALLEGVQLCDGDQDWYRVDIPAGKWLSVELIIDGSGRQGTDLDLFEGDEYGDIIWQSGTEQPYEQLAWYNPAGYDVSKYILINAYGNAAANYDLLVRTARYHEGLDCDSFYPDADATSEAGQCNRIMQFPKEDGVAQGYMVEHEPHYSNLRREVAYLVQYATHAVADQFGDTNPLALMDMSQRDGDTPGRMRGQLRHPEGTHVYGNDIDIAYYQTGDDNSGRVVCANNGYFCTGDPYLLDAERTVFFLVRLLDNQNVRVMGVDTKIAEVLFETADDMVDDGIITADEKQQLEWYTAYGEGWPFHHHHIHLSWNWEDGFEGRSAIPDGCLLGPDLDPADTEASRTAAGL